MFNCTIDFYQMFIGKGFEFCPIFEIIFRTSFMYLYTILNIRLMDKRSMGQLSSFEFIIIIALGSSVGDPMFYTNVPLIQAMIVISTIVFLARIVAKLVDKFSFIEKLITGKPILLIKNGQILEKNLKKENVTREELNSMLRMKGISNTGQVAYSFLEPSGNISILSLEKSVEGCSTLNHHIEQNNN